MRRRRLNGLCVPAKEIHKSVRMTEESYNYIMQQDGANFSDKLANLVMDHARLTGCEEIER